MSYGLLPTGFAKKPLDVIKAEIEAYQLANISAALDVSADSPIGQVNGIIAAKIAELWEVAEAVYASQYPDSASGVALDNVASITGAARLAATKSTVTVTCTGTPATVLAAGRVISVDPSGARFVTLADATIEAGGTVDVECEAEETGAVLANAGTLTEIETPVSGWTSVTNAEDADTGREIESDEELRVRRIALLEAAGDATLDAIRSEVLSVEDVTEVYVFKNDTDVTDGNGLSPHSIAVIVRGGDGGAIIEAIFNSVAAGIETIGNTSGQVVDDQGITQQVAYSRPTEIVLGLEITIDRDTDAGFDDVVTVAAIKASLAAYVDTFTIGEDAIRSKLFDPCFRDHTNDDRPAFDGILDITQIRLSADGGALGTANVTADLGMELITLDTSDITVILT